MVTVNGSTEGIRRALLARTVSEFQARAPRFLRLTAKWYVRGGIFTNVVVEQRKKGWKPAPRVDLDGSPAESNTRG